MLPSILTIYTTGDALFLQNVLNAVAMVTGTGSFVTASVIGMLVGIVLMGFKSVQTGKGFDLSSIVICIIAWNFFFGSTVKVNVHDVITEEDRPVDNVPAGVGVAGWAISNIAYGLTQIMEQAFQSPYSTTTITGGIAGNGGLFNDVTKTLNTISKIGMYPQIIQAINKDNGTKSDFRASATNFVKDCTFTAYALGYKTSSDIQNNSVSVKNTGTGDSGALDFPEANGVYFTHLKLGNSPEGVTIGCEQAWDRLDNALDVSFDNSESYFNKNLTSLLFPSEKFNENGTGNYTKGIDKATDIMSYATRGTYSVQEFMKAAIMYDLFSSGAIAVARDSNDVATAMMLAQARRQRNMQWSSEGTMFQKTMRPIMTFMEGFTYAITPFCGFLILMGMFGLKLSLKYFMLVAWVQSWLPCIAIANSYLNTTMQRAILNFAGAGNYKGYNFDSLHGVKILADTTEDFIATGGMFLGAIPVITLFIFSGSVYALNSLATRMNGQDFINEKIATPDIINPAAVMQGTSQLTSQFGVSSATGFDNVLGSITYRTGGTHMTTSSLSNMATAGFNALTGTGITNTEANQSGLNSNIMSSFIKSYREENDSGYNAMLKFGRNVATALGTSISDSEAFQVGAAFNMGLNGSHSGSNSFGKSISEKNKFGTKDLLTKIAKGSSTLGGILGNLSGQLGESYVNKVDDLVKAERSRGTDSALSEQYTANLSEGLSDAFTKAQSETNSSSLGTAEARQLSNLYNDLESATNSYNSSNSNSSSIGEARSVSMPNFARMVERNGWAQAIHARSEKLKEERGNIYTDQLNAIRNNYAPLLEGSSSNAIEATVEMIAMTQAGGNAGVESQLFLGDLMNGTSLNSDIGPVTDNTGVKGKEYYENKVAQNASRIESEAQSTRGKVQAETSTVDPNKTFESQKSDIINAHEASQSEVSGHARANNATVLGGANSRNINKLSSEVLNYGGVADDSVTNTRNQLAGSIIDHSKRMAQNTEMDKIVNGSKGIDGLKVAADQTADRILGGNTSDRFNARQYDAVKGLVSAGLEYSYANSHEDNSLFKNHVSTALDNWNKAADAFDSAFENLSPAERAAAVDGVFKSGSDFGDTNAPNTADFVEKVVDLNFLRQQQKLKKH